MNFFLLLRTIIHLRPIQIVYQIKNRLLSRKFKPYKCYEEIKDCKYLTVINKYPCYADGAFSFLNIKSTFSSWSEMQYGILWAYNLNYMDWLLQPEMSVEEGSRWIDGFIAALSKNKVGLDPYPTALRGVNWIKFISGYRDQISNARLIRWTDSLYAQYKLLERKLEYHLLGNHLLEDAYSLFIASIYFSDKEFYKKSVNLLYRELNEQILPDGAHYELSPMYHCILLDRLLDCYNFSINNNRFPDQNKITSFLREKAIRMLGHLQSILFTDGTYPLFNDSAFGIAPIPQELFRYADRVGLQWQPLEMKNCGYRRFSNHNLEVFVDIGNIMASYQPGHTHADTFNYELRVNGKPFIIDTGISTYEKNGRRQYERSTVAHNTVSINRTDSSEVWGGFRIGRRAKVHLIEETPYCIMAEHNGYRSCLHCRSFKMNNADFVVMDGLSSLIWAESYIHLAPNVEVLSVSDTCIVTSCAIITLKGAESVHLVQAKVSMEYNCFADSHTVVMTFHNRMEYSIKPTNYK